MKTWRLPAAMLIASAFWMACSSDKTTQDTTSDSIMENNTELGTSSTSADSSAIVDTSDALADTSRQSP
jgi:hypothetical protein